MKTKLCLFVLSFGLTLSLAAQSNAPGDVPQPPSLFDYFQRLNGDQLLNVTIKTDLRKLVSNKMKEDYQEGELSFRTATGEQVTWNVELRPRGNVRRQVCYYPPVKIKFKKDDLTTLGLSTKYNSYKLVNQCKAQSLYEQLLVKEFLAYQLYNVVSPYSFRVKLMKVTYIDTGRKDKPMEMTTFLIEDVEELAGRFDGVLVEREKFSTTMVEREPMILASLYEYMIGNTDWAVGNLHNLELIKVPAYEKVIAVPYDFDYSGLVNTPYAIPAEGLPIKVVTQRLYRGPTCGEEESGPAIDRMQTIQADLLKICEACPLLDDTNRRQVINYLNSFFDEVSQKRALQNSMK